MSSPKMNSNFQEEKENASISLKGDSFTFLPILYSVSNLIPHSPIFIPRVHYSCWVAVAVPFYFQTRVQINLFSEIIPFLPFDGQSTPCHRIVVPPILLSSFLNKVFLNRTKSASAFLFEGRDLALSNRHKSLAAFSGQRKVGSCCRSRVVSYFAGGHGSWLCVRSRRVGPSIYFVHIRMVCSTFMPPEDH